MSACLLCQQPLADDWSLAQWLDWRPLRLAHLCARCQAQFEPIIGPVCPGCGRPGTELCADCRRWQAQVGSLLHNHALFRYNDAMKQLIFQYKGLGDYRLRHVFSDQLQLGNRHTALVPIPSEPSHFARRGFDPVLGLFGHLPLQQWLSKRDTATPQAQKNRQERLATPQSFRAVIPTHHYRQVLLLDDLYTTGRTLYHARQALIDAGFSGPIRSFSLIR